MKKKSQSQIILETLNSGRTVDQVWASGMYIMRLAAKIKDLRDEGYRINTVTLKDSVGRVKPYCGYKIEA